MATLVAVDGAIEAAETAAVSVLDRGFSLGDGLFEVLRTYGGVPFALEEHVARLAAAAGAIGLVLPVPQATLVAEVRAVLASAENDESYIRLVVTRGRGPLGLDPAGAGPATRVIVVARLVAPPLALARDGISVALVVGTPPSDVGPVRGVKPLGYLASIVARRAAEARGAADAIFVGPHGELTEATAANLFVVRAGRVLTPPAALGILPGVTRAHVLDVARAAGLVAHEHLIFPHDLYGADEAFLTSSVRELVAVVAADGVRIGAGKPGPQTAALATGYRRRVSDATRR